MAQRGHPKTRKNDGREEAIAPVIPALFKELLETMNKAHGIGLARGKAAVGHKGCLSFPGVFADITRSKFDDGIAPIACGGHCRLDRQFKIA
jgi:peptide deformylase